MKNEEYNVTETKLDNLQDLINKLDVNVNAFSDTKAIINAYKKYINGEITAINEIPFSDEQTNEESSKSRINTQN